MNAVEIEEAISDLAALPFARAAFPFQFLEAFGNKETTIKSLKKGITNKSDIGGVLQRNNIHLLTTDPGEVDAGLNALRDSAATKKGKAKFILATDGEMIAAEELATGEPVACEFANLGDHFGFFLALAGISTIAEIKNNPIDIKATARLNKLYLELLRENPDWTSDARRHDLNQFMARLIFCFFAEDTDIFIGDDLFTATIEQMSDSRSANAHKVIAELFRAMDTKPEDRARANLRPWADTLPFVNGGLFSGNGEVPVFTRLARTYLLSAGRLNWSKINPDIFGSMIQAVADDKERGSLGMHYTSVPNILKVLNPLFLDDLREQLEAAGDNGRKLLNLRKRIANIRIFDPACGSGNFLVIAYKKMREIEAEILDRRGVGESDHDRNSAINLENFYGIEINDFPAQIAQIALLIAEYQCDVLYINQMQACKNMLPLDKANNITIGNALRLDWLEVCPPTDEINLVKDTDDDLFATPLQQPEMNFENEGGETYICSNPPYKGSQTQTKDQKEDLKVTFEGKISSTKQLDYVAGWFFKAAQFGKATKTKSAFVSTNSICQGRIVPILWPLIFATGNQIFFAYTSFKWANLASHNAGVTVVIIGIGRLDSSKQLLYSTAKDGSEISRAVAHINPYLVPTKTKLVEKRSNAFRDCADMSFGSMPNDGGHLLLTSDEVESLILTPDQHKKFIRRIYGSVEFIRGLERFCLWISDDDLEEAMAIPKIATRIKDVRQMRLASSRKTTNELADCAHRFGEVRQPSNVTSIAIPSVSSESRPYLPIGFLPKNTIVSNLAFALYDAPLWNMALIASRIHLVWIATVCGKLKTDFRYSNTLGWNTFPVPDLTEKNKTDLTRCAEDILLAREAHFPATIADLYKPDAMPENLRHAHDRNDEVLERAYIGRRFKTDTERLEKLFEMYTKMTAKEAVA